MAPKHARFQFLFHARWNWLLRVVPRPWRGHVPFRNYYWQQEDLDRAKAWADEMSIVFEADSDQVREEQSDG